MSNATDANRFQILERVFPIETARLIDEYAEFETIACVGNEVQDCPLGCVVKKDVLKNGEFVARYVAYEHPVCSRCWSFAEFYRKRINSPGDRYSESEDEMLSSAESDTTWCIVQ